VFGSNELPEHGRRELQEAMGKATPGPVLVWPGTAQVMFQATQVQRSQIAVAATRTHRSRHRRGPTAPCAAAGSPQEESEAFSSRRMPSV